MKHIVKIIFIFALIGACTESDDAIEREIGYAPPEIQPAVNETPIDLAPAREIAETQGPYLSGRILSKFVRAFSRLRQLDIVQDGQSMDSIEYYTPDITSDKTLVTGMAVIYTSANEYTIIGEYFGRIDWKTRTYTGAIKNMSYMKIDTDAYDRKDIKKLAQSYGKLIGSISLSGKIPDDYETRGFDRGDFFDVMTKNGFDTIIRGRLAYAPPSWHDLIPETQINIDGKGKTSVFSVRHDKSNDIYLGTANTTRQAITMNGEKAEMVIWMGGF